MAVTKKIPESENGPGVRCQTTSGQEYLISQCMAPRRFTLWKKVSGGYEKELTGQSPIELYDKIPWNK